MVNFLLMLLILPFDILLKVYCLGKKYLKTPDIEIDCGSTILYYGCKAIYVLCFQGSWLSR